MLDNLVDMISNESTTVTNHDGNPFSVSSKRKPAINDDITIKPRKARNTSPKQPISKVNLCDLGEFLLPSSIYNLHLPPHRISLIQETPYLTSMSSETDGPLSTFKNEHI